MDFMTAIKSVLLQNYANFKGRAGRSEYWWFYLFTCVVSGSFNTLATTSNNGLVLIFANILSLALLIPGLAVGVRRLHDINKSGWWLLLVLLPILGWIVLIYFAIKRGTEGPNRFGEPVV